MFLLFVHYLYGMTMKGILVRQLMDQLLSRLHPFQIGIEEILQVDTQMQMISGLVTGFHTPMIPFGVLQTLLQIMEIEGQLALE